MYIANVPLTNNVLIVRVFGEGIRYPMQIATSTSKYIRKLMIEKVIFTLYLLSCLMYIF